MIRNKNVINAGWIIGCKIIQSVLGVVISMLTARYLGPAQFGVINYAAAVVAFFAPVAKLGLNHIIVQEIVTSPNSEGEILGTSVGMSLLSSFLCVVGVVAFSSVASPDDKETIVVCTLYSTIMIAQTLEFIQYWFQSKLMSKYPSVVSVIVFFVISIYKTVLILTGQNVYWFAVSNAADHLIIGIALWFIYKNKCRNKMSFSVERMRDLFSKSKYFIVSGMMVTIFAQTDKVMLKFMIDETATGIYAAASTCAGLTSFVFAAVIDSTRPTVVEDKKKSVSVYKNDLCRLYSVVIFASLMQSVAMTILAKPIILILYGSEFMEAVSVLGIVVWYTTFSYIGAVRNIWILAENKQRYLWVINLSGALTNVALNLILIPLWGIRGAAAASVVTQMFTNFILGFIMKPLRENNRLMIKSLNPVLLADTVKFIVKRKKPEFTEERTQQEESYE